MDLTIAVAAFVQQRRLQRRTSATIDVYHYQLAHLWLPWRARQGLPTHVAALTFSELQTYLDDLAYRHINARTGQVGLAHATVQSVWRALRAFWHYALRQGWLPAAQPSFRAAVTLPPPHTTPPAAPPPWPALLAACAQLTDPEERARTRLVLRLLEAGLRPGQVAALRDATVDLHERRATVVQPSGRVVVVTWGHAAAVALRAYRRVRSGPASGAMVRGVSGSGLGQPLSTSMVRRIVRRLGAGG